MSSHQEMTIDDALNSILGVELATSIIGDMGIHWAVVTAYAIAVDNPADPLALRALRRYSNETAAQGEPNDKHD